MFESVFECVLYWLNNSCQREKRRLETDGIQRKKNGCRNTQRLVPITTSGRSKCTRQDKYAITSVLLLERTVRNIGKLRAAITCLIILIVSTSSR